MDSFIKEKIVLYSIITSAANLVLLFAASKDTTRVSGWLELLSSNSFESSTTWPNSNPLEYNERPFERQCAQDKTYATIKDDTDLALLHDHPSNQQPNSIPRQ